MVAKILKIAGFGIVTYVLVESLFLTDVPNMSFEFGGLIVGGALFLLGRMFEDKE